MQNEYCHPRFVQLTKALGFFLSNGVHQCYLKDHLGNTVLAYRPGEIRVSLHYLASSDLGGLKEIALFEEAAYPKMLILTPKSGYTIEDIIDYFEQVLPTYAKRSSQAYNWLLSVRASLSNALGMSFDDFEDLEDTSYPMVRDFDNFLFRARKNSYKLRSIMLVLSLSSKKARQVYLDFDSSITYEEALKLFPGGFESQIKSKCPFIDYIHREAKGLGYPNLVTSIVFKAPVTVSSVLAVLKVIFGDANGC